MDKDGKKAPVTRDLDILHADFTMQGKLNTDKDVVKWLIENVPAFKPWKFENAVERGFITLNSNAGLTSPLYADKPYRSFEEQFYLKRPYPTLSGRQQFYIDQEVFLKLKCTVPTARESLHPAKFPLKFYSPHTRWGIHSTWRTQQVHAAPAARRAAREPQSAGRRRARHPRRRHGAGVQRRRRVSAMAKLMPACGPARW